MPDEFKVLIIQQMSDVVLASREEIVQTYDIIAVVQ